VVDETDVEGCVVNDQLGAFDELEEAFDDLRKTRLVEEEFVADAVDLDGSRVDLAVGLQVLVQAVAGRPPVHDLDTADLDDPVSVRRLKAGGLRVEDDLAHLQNLHGTLVSCHPSNGVFSEARSGQLQGTCPPG